MSEFVELVKKEVAKERKQKFSLDLPNIGEEKKAKLEKMMFDRGFKNGKLLFLPVDQGIEHGPVDFLVNPPSIDPEFQLKLAIEGNYSGIVFQIGLAKKYWAKKEYKKEIPLVLKLNGKTNIPSSAKALSPMNCSVKEAKKIGATALFGEKYGDVVRVVEVKDFSKELCGGKHVSATGEIGLFKIVTEVSVASGVRRIEAVTGETAFEIIQKNENTIRNIEKITATPKEQLITKIESLQDEIKTLHKQIQELQQKNWKYELDDLIKNSESINGVKVVTHQLENVDMNELKKIGDIVRNKLQNGVGVLASVVQNKPLLAVVVTDDTIKKYGLKAGDIVREMGKVLGGGGGGKPHMATAGGKDITKIPQAFERFYEIIKDKTL